ncbi:MAG TPA: hypothetical protein VK517_02360 [Cyclobacteriaceae bacterium]|nr:hypothetical protein [Cyclobacteriaceae bacterium]
MIQRIYIDTSVAGGLFDIEFSTDTKPFFDKVEKGALGFSIRKLPRMNSLMQVRNYLNHLTPKEI